MTAPPSEQQDVSVDDEEDWETADLDTIVQAPLTQTRNPKSRGALLKNLRPTAPAFQPPKLGSVKTTAVKQLYDPTSPPATIETIPHASGAVLGTGANGGEAGAPNGSGELRNAVSTGASSSRTIIPPQSASLPPRPTSSSSPSTSSSNPHLALSPSDSNDSIASTSSSAPPKTILLKRPETTPTMLVRPPTLLSRPSPSPPPQPKSFPASSYTSGISSPAQPQSQTSASASASTPLSGPSSPTTETNDGARGIGRGEASHGEVIDAWDMSRIPVERASNRQIWTAANSSSSSSSSIPNVQSQTTPNAPALPPPTSLRILRRGNPNDPYNSSGTSSPLSAADREREKEEKENEREKRKKTLEEREEEYRKARERIFGVSEGGGESTDGAVATSEVGWSGSTGVATPSTGTGTSSTIEDAVAAALAAVNLDLAERSGSNGNGGRSNNVGVGKGKERDHSDSLDANVSSNAERRSQSSSRQPTLGPGSGLSTSSPNNNSNNNNNRKTSNNQSRRPARGEGSTFEMLRPPPDAAYRVSARSQGGGMGLPGVGGYGGQPGTSMGYGAGAGGVIRQPLGPDDLNSVGFAAGQRFAPPPPSMGMGQFGGNGMVGIGQAGLGSATDFGYGYGGTQNQYQQAAYMQQHQQAQLQLQYQQMHMQGMLSPQQVQAYAAMTGYDTVQYGGQGMYGIGQPGGSGSGQQSGQDQTSPSARTVYNSQGFVQSTAPTGLASSMSTEDDPAFVVQPRLGQPGYGENGPSMAGGPYNPQADFPALPGSNTRPGTLSSRSSSSSGSRGGGAKRKQKVWGPASRG